jgi:DNA processing protein
MRGEAAAWVRLHLTRGLGRAGLIRLIAAFGSPEAALAAAPSTWQKQAGVRDLVAASVPAADDPLLAQSLAELNRLSVRIITLWDEDLYPPLLRTIHDPPALLYLRGALPPGEALAVVGARRASSAGRRLTEELCRELAARDIAVVSGLARGIDSAAHLGALAGGGPTLGVLGCGIDQIYPPENAPLFLRLADQGGILSEYPPGTPPLAGHFPGRNRIISGLARGVLVVEAAEGSGSLITVDFALEQGREVFAVPGAVHAATSGGVNRLLKEGAHLVTGIEDILQVLWPRQPGRTLRKALDSGVDELDPKTRKVFGELSENPLHIDELAGISGLTPMEVSTILLNLELNGGVQQLPGMRFVRSRG